MPHDPGYKNLKLEKGDIWGRIRDDLTAAAWRDKTYIHILTHTHNFCDEHENAIKPYITEQYNWHMRYCGPWGQNHEQLFN
jgi:hypothetical protein